jgi:ribosomal protein S12 methylthiotransferase
MPRSPGKTIHFVSLGCPKNRVDTEVMLGVSDQAGYRLVSDPAEAEVIVVNTCGFIEEAKQESIETIFSLAELKETGACKRLVVAGCLSQRYPTELATEMPEVDHFLGSSDMLALGGILRSEALDRMQVGNPADYVFKLGDPRRLSAATHSAYVKIAEGCSRKCAFCAIPSFRGTQRSRPLADVVGETQRLVDAGTVEINLISQDTIAYGRDLDGADATTLTALTEALCEVKGLRWLRLFYLYPDLIDARILELMAGPAPLVPYVDIPFQHASDAMLKRMRRGYRARRQREIVEQLRSSVPDLSIRTSFIVGHPGETDADFAELCELVSWGRFDHVGVFRYSVEDGTVSGGMEDRVAEDVIEARAAQLMELQRPISAERLKRFVGRELEILVEGESEESELLLQGRHSGQAPDIDGVVHLISGTAQPGQLVRARITQAGDYDLVGDLSVNEKRSKRLPLAT